MKKRLSEAVLAGMFFLILAVISWKICGSNIEGGREGAVVSKETAENNQHKDTEEMIEIQAATENSEEATEEYIIGEKPEEEYRVYDEWHDIGDIDVDPDPSTVPYTDDKTFEIIKSAYEEVDPFGEFEKGNLDVCDEYKELFVKVARNEEPFLDKETGEEIYLGDYTLVDYDINEAEYYFFDVDGDSYPELGVIYDCQKYMLKYDSEEKNVFLWNEFSTWGQWFGTRKWQMGWDGIQFHFHQLDENGEDECVVFYFFVSRTEVIYIVGLPEYADKEKEVVVTEEMKEHGMFARADGRWYFRVTEEQYEEIAVPYREAELQALEEEKEVRYTYDELFGSLDLT